MRPGFFIYFPFVHKGNLPLFSVDRSILFRISSKQFPFKESLTTKLEQMISPVIMSKT
ncbi:hypothetical protein JNUCC1_01134 [Lentibacillus sp. JNUCC-1]|nr:hypothetical protein [Lentibacillus sp. JNUCC-1]